MVEQNGHSPSRSTASTTSGAVRKTARVLGTLESQLMEVLWKSSSELSVQQVCDALGPGHNYKTVMTVLNRLVEKELLERKLDGRAYRYRPQLTRSSFLRSAADDMVQGYLQAYGQDAAGHLSSAVDTVAPKPPGGSLPPQPPPPPPSPEASASPVSDASPASDATGPVLLGGLSLGKIALAAAVLEAIVLIFGRGRRRGR